MAPSESFHEMPPCNAILNATTGVVEVLGDDVLGDEDFVGPLDRFTVELWSPEAGRLTPEQVITAAGDALAARWVRLADWRDMGTTPGQRFIAEVLPRPDNQGGIG